MMGTADLDFISEAADRSFHEAQDALDDHRMDLFTIAREKHQAWTVLWQRIIGGFTVH